MGNAQPWSICQPSRSYRGAHVLRGGHCLPGTHPLPSRLSEAHLHEEQNVTAQSVSDPQRPFRRAPLLWPSTHLKHLLTQYVPAERTSVKCHANSTLVSFLLLENTVINPAHATKENITEQHTKHTRLRPRGKGYSLIQHQCQ